MDPSTPCPRCGASLPEGTNECPACGDEPMRRALAEISELHEANDADLDRKVRSRDWLISFFIVAGLSTAVFGFFCIVSKPSAALTIASLTVGALAVLTLAFKIAAAALVDHYAPTHRALILALALCLSGGALQFLARSSLEAAATLASVQLVLTSWIAMRLFHTTFGRGLGIAVGGFLVAALLFALIGGTIARITGP